LNSYENHKFQKDKLNLTSRDNRSPYQINGNTLNLKKFDYNKSKPVLSINQHNCLYSESNNEYKHIQEYGAFKNIQSNEMLNSKIKLEVKRHNPSLEDNFIFNDKDSNDCFKKINNISEKIFNKSCVNDSFYKNENYCQNTLETEINDVNYILTEVDCKEKKAVEKFTKSKKDKKSADNFINKVRDALNFSNLIRNNHLLFNKDSSNINKKINASNKNNYKNNINNEKKYLESSIHNTSQVNNISIYSKKENNSSGNNTKRLSQLPFLDSNIIVKDNSPIANMIKGYFNELENKENTNYENNKNNTEPSNMNNIINIGCANFISNNINNNFTENKNLENKKYGSKNKEKQKEFQKINIENNFNNSNKHNINLSVDKIKEYFESKDSYSEKENFKSPEFGNSKTRSIIKVKKPEEDSNSKEIQEHSFNVKDLNKALEEICIEKTLENELKKENKNLNIKSNSNKFGKVNMVEPLLLLNTHKSLSSEKGNNDFYISQKNFKKKNIERDNINNNNKKEYFSIYLNKFIKTENDLTNSYLKKQIEINRNISDQKDSENKDFRSKTSKNIKKIINVKNKRNNGSNYIDEASKVFTKRNSIIEKTQNNNKLEEILQNSQEEVYDDHKKFNEKKLLNNDKIINLEMKLNYDILNNNGEINQSIENPQINENISNEDKISLNELENKNEINIFYNNSVPEINDNNSKDDKSQLKQGEHKKNFSFGVSKIDKNNGNHFAKIINGNYNTENKESKNFKKIDINENPNLSKNNTFSNKKIKVISLNKKNNNSELSNKDSINGNNNNNHRKKLSLEIKTDFIESLNEKKNEMKKVILQTTRNSINVRDHKIDFNAFEKVNTTKSSNNKKIEFTKSNNNKLNENFELNNTEKSQDAKKNQKFNSRNSFSKALNINNLKTENKENNSSKLNKNLINNDIKENLICTDNNKIDENKCVNSNQNDIYQEVEITKKLTKNLSIINEKENSDKKPEATLKAYLTNKNLNKNAKKYEKNNRKNFSMDLGNFNTSFQKESSIIQNNQNQIILERNNKSKKIEDTRMNKEIPVINKKASKEKGVEITEKSNIKKDRNKLTKNKENNNSNTNNLNKETISNKNQNKRLNTKVNVDDNSEDNYNSSKCKNEESLISEEKEILKENNINSSDEKRCKENKTSQRLSFEKNRSNSINNNIVLLNNLNENKVNNCKNNKTSANVKFADPIKRRSISQDRLIENKKNIESQNLITDKSQKSYENLNVLDNKNKRKNAFKNTSLINDEKEKIKEKKIDSHKEILENNIEINPKKDLSRKSIIINNKIKDTSNHEIEKENNQKNIGNNNIKLKNQKLKDISKPEKEGNKSKKNLKIELVEKVSSSKVRKVLRPNNWKNKKSETNDENITNEDLIQETEEENANLNPKEIQSDAEKNDSELIEEEKRIDSLTFDNMLKNIKIDDDAIYKGKEENSHDDENESVDVDNNLTSKIKEENNMNQNNESLLTEKNNDRKITFEVRVINNLEINDEKDKEISKNANNENEINIYEINNKDESRINENINKNDINIEKKYTNESDENMNENNKLDKYDNFFTPKFSPLKRNSNNSENNIKIEEGICIKKNLEKKFENIQLNLLNRCHLENYIQDKKNSRKNFNCKKEEIFYLLFNSK